MRLVRFFKRLFSDQTTSYVDNDMVRVELLVVRRLVLQEVRP